MAKLASTRYPAIVEVIGPRGRCEALVRSTGAIVKRRESGGHSEVGTIKPGLTVGQLAEIWTRKYPTCRILKHADDDCIIMTQVKWDARQQARGKAREKDRTERERILASLPEAYRTADPFVLWSAYEVVKFSVMTAIGCQYMDCGRILDTDRAIVSHNMAICADHGMVADTMDGQSISFHGPMLRAALRAR